MKTIMIGTSVTDWNCFGYSTTADIRPNRCCRTNDESYEIYPYPTSK